VTRWAVTFLLLTVLLGAVAALAPQPSYKTDRDTYESIGRQTILLDCSDLHCFRVLVPWLLEPLPGPTLFKWKAYAVLANASAAIALGRLCLLLGLTWRGSLMAAWLAALGFGAMFTVYDPHTSDPLMFLLGPLVLGEMLRSRRGRGGLIASVGVFAKEFAAAPLWIYTLWMVLRRQWELAVRGLAAAGAATLLWVGLQLWLMLRFNYTYAGSASTDLLGGGNLVGWLGRIGWRGAASAVFTEFGALWLLIPVGLVRGGRDLRMLALAVLPAALVLGYVQQPDRAWWNFHFVAIPLAVIALQQLHERWCWLFIACYGAANLRFGAQLPLVPPGRFPLIVSLAIAAAAVAANLRRPALILTPSTDVT
jgi:hypothetical protein